jgi:hypothetical protein
MGWQGVNGIHLAQDMNTVTVLRDPQKTSKGDWSTKVRFPTQAGNFSVRRPAMVQWIPWSKGDRSVNLTAIYSWCKIRGALPPFLSRTETTLHFPICRQTTGRDMNASDESN